MIKATVRMRARQTRALVVPLLRAVRWRPVLAAACVAAALVALMRAQASYEPGMALRWTAVVLSLGGAFLLDDGAASLVAATPATLLYRRLLRVVLGALVIAGSWWALAMYATSWNTGAVPFARAGIELAALVSVTMFVAAAGIRVIGEGRGGSAAGPTLLFLLLIAGRLPARWAVLVGPTHPRWDAAGRDLLAVTVVASVGLLALSFDPARRRIGKRLLEGGTAAAGGERFRSAGKEEV